MRVFGEVSEDFWVGNVRAQKRRYTTIAYRFFRDVHEKHVRTTSNMTSRQWSAAKCREW